MAGESSDVVVTVLRVGGFAGVRRMWRVSPEESDQLEWVELIDQCPWDDLASNETESLPDRFVWSIHARTADADRNAEMGESALIGAWRNLVERVRESGDPVPLGTKPGETGRASPVL